MRIICLDLEGVLVPEIWINLANRTKIEGLRLTTRDIKNYDELMAHRLNILRKKELNIKDILEAVRSLEPFKGAVDFLKQLSKKYQVIILSDTFYEIAYPLIAKLDFPNVFCHHLNVSDKGKVLGYKLHINNQKKAAVKAFKALNFEVFAVGDSYNDIDMLKEADLGILFMASEALKKEYPKFISTSNYKDLINILEGNF